METLAKSETIRAERIRIGEDVGKGYGQWRVYKNTRIPDGFSITVIADFNLYTETDEVPKPIADFMEFLRGSDAKQ